MAMREQMRKETSEESKEKTGEKTGERVQMIDVRGEGTQEKGERREKR